MLKRRLIAVAACAFPVATSFRTFASEAKPAGVVEQPASLAATTGDTASTDIAATNVSTKEDRMSKAPFDHDAAAHRHYSVNCFNQAWELIDKKERTSADNLKLLATSYASLYHWMQRPDCTAKELSIGTWQVSRVHAILGQPEAAARMAQECLTHSEALPAFFKGYAHEALARASALTKDKASRDQHLMLARKFQAGIEDQEELSMLKADLDELSR